MRPTNMDAYVNIRKPWTMDSSGENEASKDPGICQPSHQGYTEQDFEGHRAHTVFVGVHMPGGRRHSHRRHKHHHRDSDKPTDFDRPRSGSIVGLSRRRMSITTDDGATIITPPAQRVQFILGEDVDDGTHESHPLFSEMEELVKEGDELEWKETARWVKFEEDVEEGGNRWSKPHVATLSLHSLFELRSLLTNGTVMLDMIATSLEEVADLVCDNMVNAGSLPTGSREKVREALLRRHRHQHEQAKKKDNNMSRLPIIRSLAEIGRNHSTSKNSASPKRPNSKSSYSLRDAHSPEEDIVPASQSGGLLSRFNKDQRGSYLAVPTGDDMVKSPSNLSMQRNTSASDLHHANGSNGNDLHKGNTHFMKKIPHGAEASNILVGEVDFLDKTLSAFIRLNEAAMMGDLTEVPVPTRFLFILLGPPGSHGSFHEIGRAMATLMSDEIFHEVAYRARKRDHLLAGIDEFLDAVTVLPPGEWDPTIRIEPPAAIPSQEDRKRPPEKPKKEEVSEEQEEQRLRDESGLSRSGRFFGGLINDLKRKKPWYLSDFKDALSSQCVASWIFLYFACLSPIITFGGLLGEATGKNMAAMESLVAGFVCGIGYGFFSGQPLTILGSTGPVLVFETIVYDFCTAYELDYMSFRFWIGTWIVIILVVLVAVDASALVCYITRFTEENFATLIAFIFIFKAIENVLSIRKRFPVNPPEFYDCRCGSPDNSTESLPWATYDKKHCIKFGGTLFGADCGLPEYEPNVFLMSVILFLGTFITSVILKDFKNALFFPSKVRQFISDFAVIIAIFSMSILDYTCNISTPKLEVPSEFKPTLSKRGWIISPFVNPMWSWIVAIAPALLGTILIFMDQQITAVIVNRKENKLKKGCGYHLDLFVLAILIQICTVMGLPWFVAATVLSINHVNSLKLESECAAPGEKPQFLGVREQRVTHIFIFLMIGCSVLLTPLLSHIPMPVLFGVFLYMGVASLKGLQFFDRILIIFMPVKYQPDFMFLRQVPIKRVHLFTLIQFVCLVVLWLIKSFSQTSILFPLMLVFMVGIRKSLDFVFTRRELKILDDIMPEITRRAAAEDLHHLDDVEDPPPEYPGNNAPSNIITNGKLASQNAINITEEFNKTNIWKQVNDGKSKRNDANSENRKYSKNQSTEKKSKSNNRRDLSPNGEQRLSTMKEEEECQDINRSELSKSAQNLSQSKAYNNIKDWCKSKVISKDVAISSETSV
ncbi:electroneutral sodium bicarbonate exchanger 1 isoform X3 [Bradysia coprophila]|uniref:electroneutral sodium bicarbonate exchanger 1 isoform X3 n=1 Tax=Bradysia coprophila TaxID=38358 RepID=UPI00187DC6F1|nr:electroneutral sodium bicarbonate exchanger 1 isoform X3 [Bradysia coprophila]